MKYSVPTTPSYTPRPPPASKSPIRAAPLWGAIALVVGGTFGVVLLLTMTAPHEYRIRVVVWSVTVVLFLFVPLILKRIRPQRAALVVVGNLQLVLISTIFAIWLSNGGTQISSEPIGMGNDAQFAKIIERASEPKSVAAVNVRLRKEIIIAVCPASWGLLLASLLGLAFSIQENPGFIW